ncbi:MAG TPA: ABC-2 family transporter protein [Actinomycetota bacterium]|nr:ABC-2 family transporter protein [Actinomycetota bacterium]
MKNALAVFRTATAEAAANRRSLGFQMAIMIANDVAWVGFWILFFRKVGEVRGWDANRMLVLFAILTTLGGIALGLFSNCRHVGRLAAGGELDHVLTLPVDPLAYTLTRKIEPIFLGDLAFGVVLFVLAGDLTVERTLLYLAASLCGAAVLIGFLVFGGSLTFFSRGRGEAGELGFQAILLLSSYPLEIFGGATKVLLFTAVPAAFVSGLPTRLVEDFDVVTAAVLVAAAAGFLGLGSFTFRLGLRRYTSGALWTRA